MAGGWEGRGLRMDFEYSFFVGRTLVIRISAWTSTIFTAESKILGIQDSLRLRDLTIMRI